MYDRNNKELLTRMKKRGFLNKEKFDDIQLENLKFYVNQKIPKNILKFQVFILIFIHLYSDSFFPILLYLEESY